MLNYDFVNDDPRLTEREAAAFLSMSPKTLKRWRYEGRGPEWDKIGRAVRYRLSALKAFIQPRPVAAE